MLGSLPMSSSHDHAHHHAGHEPAHGHGHGHAHHDHAHHAPKNFDRAFGFGIALNLSFVAVEAFYGWKVDSLALLADAGHNLSDVAGLVLAWGAAWAGRLRPDPRHSYGWKRAGILAAFTNAVLLLVAMGSLAWEAVHRLQAPLPLQGATVMVVAGIGIVINGLTAWLFMRGGEDDLNIRGAYLHMAADALVSAGVVVAGGLALAFGWHWLDPVASAAPDSKPNRLMAAATASSKKLLAPISADGQATLCDSPSLRLSPYASAELKNTWIPIGTASIAMTSGCFRIASPWKANSSTSVASKAAIDQGPIRAKARSNAAWPWRSRACRQTCAISTGITM